jgi:hypothetical protein
MSNGYWLLIILIAVATFFVYATKKRWVTWRGNPSMSFLTAYHDWQPKDKQEAIEYVMEEKAGKKMEEQENGQETEKHK